MSKITDKLGYKIIDPWINLFLPEHTGLWKFSEPARAIAEKFHRLDVLLKGFTAEEMIREMDNAGVEKGILSSYGQENLENPEIKNPTNEDVLKISKQYPDRFIAAGGFNSLRFLYGPKGIMDCVRKLEDYVRQGLKVLKIVPFLTQLPINDKILYPLYSKCVELNIPVTINVGICGPLYPSAVAQNPIALDDICINFPDLVVVAAHMGHPWESLIIRLMEKYQNLYLMTSAYGPKYIVQEMIQFMNGRGSHKVMFSPDWPLASFDTFLKQAVELPLKPEALKNYLRDNALRVFGWE